MTEFVARLSGIERRFGSVVALSGADLELHASEVHGVLGANGAGKTTLLNVLGGMLRPDAGTIEVGGAPVVLGSPRDAWRHGIALVHQHFTLVPTMTVLDNLVLGQGRSWSGRRMRGLTSPVAEVRLSAERLMDQTGLRVPFAARIEELSVGHRQRTEILKALLREPQILVLDEPTAVLTPDETVGLFSLLRDLAREGRAVVLVAHKVDEILSVADRVTVLREGRTVLETVPRDYEITDYVRAMVGTDRADAISVRAGESHEAATRKPGERVVRIEGVRLQPTAAGYGLVGVDLEVREGEIVGIAGVEGNGQRELALLLAGRVSVEEGVVSLPRDIGFIPQDRTTEGLIADFTVSENVALAFQRDAVRRDRFWLRWSEIEERAEEIRGRYGIVAPSVGVLAGTLSGGNQQRVVVGREITMAGDLLVADNPTRGLDVAAAAFVHEELRRLASEGAGVVLVSTDLDEVLGLSDRVFAMARGRLFSVPEDARTREGVGALMLGGDDGSA